MRDTVHGATFKIAASSATLAVAIWRSAPFVDAALRPRTFAPMPLVIASESKAELEQSRDSARRALRGLRDRMREQAVVVRNGALTVGGAFGAGYARGYFGPEQYQIMGYDASLVVGALGVALGLYTGGDTGEMAMHAGVGMLSEYAAREGEIVATKDDAAPATQGSQADYLRAYAGQQP